MIFKDQAVARGSIYRFEAEVAYVMLKLLRPKCYFGQNVKSSLVRLCQLFSLEIKRFDESPKAYLHVFCYDKLGTVATEF
tara:strand:- start:153 stop:392 length:240 start_codon:yes stop_codon:yes gene_type:complete